VSPTAGYLASYSDVDMEKVGERLVTSDKQIADLRGTCGSNSTIKIKIYKIIFVFVSHLHIS
jgi:hypothetical protein